ncbi:MAG: bifunctional riboflavin kinase/FAD synthetase [Bacillota bacterium]
MKHMTTKEIQLHSQSVVTLGNFDGVHLGHRELIKTAYEIAQNKGMQSVVLTFAPHPKLVFQKPNQENPFALIMSREEKKRVIGSMGVDIYIEYPFDRNFAMTTPQVFFEEILIKLLQCKVLIIGEDYHFGANRQGNITMLKELGELHGVEVISIPAVMQKGERISSTRVRDALIHKNFDEVKEMLTTPYFILGTVVQGKQLGRTIGFPTINVEAEEHKLFPPNGVYATQSLIDGVYYFGVTNIGHNPTVNGSQKIIETHLFDFQEDVYGKEIQTFVYHFLRSEKKFNGIEELMEQIAINAEQAKTYFRENYDNL